MARVAAEPIARELHAGLSTVQWAVSGYLLALGAGLAGTACLARRFGTLPVYRASVVAFTIASALCALAPDAGGLVAARVVQGLAAAPLVPLAKACHSEVRKRGEEGVGRADDERAGGKQAALADVGVEPWPGAAGCEAGDRERTRHRPGRLPGPRRNKPVRGSGPAQRQTQQ
jgi:MFS family permease